MKKEYLSHLRTVLLYLAGAGFLLAGLLWIYGAIFAAYRPQLRPVMGVFGVLSVLLSLGLFQRSRLCLVILLTLAGGAFVFAGLLQYWGGHVDPILAGGAVISVLYWVVLLPSLRA